MCKIERWNEKGLERIQCFDFRYFVTKIVFDFFFEFNLATN